ncbi:hypothetical protein Tco_0477272 [Tanacetum coccineum]
MAKYETAKLVWDHLAKLYIHSNFAKHYQLETDIRALLQNDTSIQDFNSSMSALWDQLALTEPASLSNYDPYIKQRESQPLVQFLMTLRQDFEGLRGLILHREPLPSIDSVVSELLAEEFRLKSLDVLGLSPCDYSSIDASYKLYNLWIVRVFFVSAGMEVNNATNENQINASKIREKTAANLGAGASGVSCDGSLKSVDINTKATSYARAAGASAKDQPKVNSNFRPLVTDPVFDDVNISIPRKVVEKVNSEADLVDAVTIGIPSLTEDDFTKEIIRVEYEWRPPMCDLCKIFGHVHDHCPKKMTSPPIATTSNVVTPIVEKTNDNFQTINGSVVALTACP